MKKMLLVLFLLAGVMFSQNEDHFRCKHPDMLAAKAAKMMEINYPGDEGIDITYYFLDLNITHTPSYLIGKVQINAKAKNANTTDFFFDLQNTFTVDSVYVNDEKVSFTHADDKISFSGMSFAQDEEFSSVIYYQGSPGTSGFGSYEVTYHGQGNQYPIIWTLSEPYGASDWFPCKDTPSDKADSSTVWVTADSFYTVVSNGLLQDIVDNGDGTNTTKWHSKYRIAHYLISIAMTNYQHYTNYFHYTEIDSMPVENYNYPERWDDLRKAQLDEAITMLEIFSDKYGLYPFIDEKYGHAEYGWGGAMEHQTASSMGAYYDLIVAHEMAHQWYGDKITCADWQSIWLNEGFATFSEALYREERYGKAQYMDQILKEMGTSGNPYTAKGAVGTIYVQDISSVSQIFNGARSYAKAGVVLHMLRGVLGDEKFFETMKTYASYPGLAYDVAVTEDFQAVAEEVSETDLDYFFQEWIYGENYPKYYVEYAYEELAGNETKITINVDQAANNNPSFFTMPLQFEIKTSEVDSVFTFFNDQKTQQFEVTVAGNLPTVTFDPDNWIMKDVITVTGLDEAYLLEDYKLLQNFPNPFNPSTTIYYSVPAQNRVTLKVYDLTGSLVETLVDEVKEKGLYHVTMSKNSSGRELSSGVYFYTLQAGDRLLSKKMTILK